MRCEGLIRHVGLSEVDVEEIEAAQAFFPRSGRTAHPFDRGSGGGALRSGAGLGAAFIPFFSWPRASWPGPRRRWTPSPNAWASRPARSLWRISKRSPAMLPIRHPARSRIWRRTWRRPGSCCRTKISRRWIRPRGELPRPRQPVKAELERWEPEQLSQPPGGAVQGDGAVWRAQAPFEGGQGRHRTAVWGQTHRHPIGDGGGAARCAAGGRSHIGECAPQGVAQGQALGRGVFPHPGRGGPGKTGVADPSSGRTAGRPPRHMVAQLAKTDGTRIGQGGVRAPGCCCNLASTRHRPRLSRPLAGEEALQIGAVTQTDGPSARPRTGPNTTSAR